MLTVPQFYALTEQILKANIDAGLGFLRFETAGNDKSKMIARFKIGSARPFEWKLLSTGNKVFFVNDITRRGVNLVLDSSMKLDADSMNWIKSVIAKSSQTVFSVIQELLFDASSYATEKSDEYYKVYPNIHDFEGRTGMNVWIKIGNQQAVPLNIADQSEELTTNLASIGRLELDIIGEKFNQEASDGDKKNTVSTFVPLFKLVISNGVLSITRYTNMQMVAARDSEGRKVMNDDGTPAYENTRPNLSHVSSKIDISSISKDYKDDNSLSNQLMKVFSDFTIDDSLTSTSSFDTEFKSPKAVVGWSSKLQQMESAGKIAIVHANSGVRHALDANLTKGYCIDEFLDVYKSDLDVRISISRDSTHAIKISYGGGRQFGTIVELLIDADPKDMVNTKDLNSEENAFVILKSAHVLVRCNTGHGETQEVTTNISSAMTIVRQMVAIFACIGDVATLTRYTTSDSLRHAKTRFDDYNSAISYNIVLRANNPVIGRVLIYSLTSTNKLGLQIAVYRDALRCEMINVTTGQPLGNQYAGVYNASTGNISEQGKKWMDEFKATKKPSATTTLGAIIAMFIMTKLNKHVMSDKKGETLSEDEALQKITKMSRMSTANDMGRMAMAVQKAFFNTFNANGVTVIGTAENPSVFDWNFSSFSQVAKPVKGEDGSVTYEPQLIEFNINMGYGGNFSVMRNSKHEAEAHCGYRGGQSHCIIDIDPNAENPTLTDEFLQWYLFNGLEEGNPIATGIERIIDRAEDDPNDKDMQAIPDRIVDMLYDPKTPMDVDDMINQYAEYSEEAEDLPERGYNPDEI